MTTTKEWKPPSRDAPLDQWATWLIIQRFAQRSLEEQLAAVELLQTVRDRVLQGADIHKGDTVLDIGAGTGLLALGALAAVGPTGRVIAADISLDSLRVCMADAAKLPIDHAPVAVVTDGVRLAVAQQTCDVVVLRSVLIYIANKDALLRECYRVLRNGGRLSLFEPINRERCNTLDLSGLPSLLQEKLHRIEKEHAQNSARVALAGFSADDLVRVVSEVGFSTVECVRDFAVETLSDEEAVERYLARVPAPGQPSPSAFYQQHITPEEWQIYHAYWIASVQRAPVLFKTPVVYITARK